MEYITSPKPYPESLRIRYSLIGQPPSFVGFVHSILIDVKDDVTHVGVPGIVGRMQAYVVKGSEYSLSPLKLKALCLKV